MPARIGWPPRACRTMARPRSVAGHHPVGHAISELQPLTDLECSVHVELPVHALLHWPEVGGRLHHWDYLGPVDLVGVPIGHNGRRAFVEDVLQPIGALTIREGDQEAVIMLDRDDRCLIRPARSPPDMADDRRVGSFRAGLPQSERPHGSGEQAQGILKRTSHAPNVLSGCRLGVGPKGLEPPEGLIRPIQTPNDGLQTHPAHRPRRRVPGGMWVPRWPWAPRWANAARAGLHIDAGDKSW